MSRLTGGEGPRPVFKRNEEHRPGRPAMRPRVPGDTLFHDAGPTGWKRKRDLGDYKGVRSELDFRHLHDKFTHDVVEDE